MNENELQKWLRNTAVLAKMNMTDEEAEEDTQEV